jgi:hypothetical protein
MTANSYAEFPRLFVVCPEESNTSPQETFTCSGVTFSLAYLLLHCHCHPQHHCPQPPPPPPLTTTNHPSPLTTIANYKYFWIKKITCSKNKELCRKISEELNNSTLHSQYIFFMIMFCYQQ